MDNPTETRNAFLTVRVSEATRRQFHVRASKFGRSAEVLREIIEAFNSERLVIRRNPQAEKESLYVD